jgi:hypothetical protein
VPWIYSEHLTVGGPGNQKLWYCSFGEMENPGTNVDFAFFKNRMVNPYGKFSEHGFPHNFAQKMIATT